MSARYLDGHTVADAVLDGVAQRILGLAEIGRKPGLGTILVGNDPASVGYVRKKHQMCETLGITSFDVRLPADTRQQDLLDAVREFNANADIDAFLIQHPVPRGLDFNEALRHMDAGKDADGLHPLNLGRLVLQEAGPVPCTPAGIQAILGHYGISVSGREVIIVGRGPTLGRPLSLMLSAKAEDANAAVTVVHSGVPDLAHYTRRADILIAAAGVPGIVKPRMVRPGAVVVSGGINWEGRKLLPDVDEEVEEVADWITPRLGGVGPTTIAMLMRNVVGLCENRWLNRPGIAGDSDS